MECEIMKIIQKKPHPNIIQLEEILEDNSNIYIIQEYATCGDLLTLLQKCQISEDEVKKLMRSILSAVVHLHTIGIIHRDLKLENILLDDQHNPKLADFGLSCHWHPLKEIQSFCGSPLYCAPEMITKHPYMGPEVDVWSCGVIFFTCMWNTFPFPFNKCQKNQDEAMKEVLTNVVKKDVEMPSSNQRGSSAVRKLIQDMLLRNKDFRITTWEILDHSWMREDDNLLNYSEDRFASEEVFPNQKQQQQNQTEQQQQKQHQHEHRDGHRRSIFGASRFSRSSRLSVMKFKVKNLMQYVIQYCR